MMMTMTTMTSTISNSTGRLPDHIHIVSVPNHEELKKRILFSIDCMIDDNDFELNEKGYYYDFDKPNIKRLYDQDFKQAAAYGIKELEYRYGLQLNKFGTSWFQQYFQDSGFGWHQHDGHWAVVYYVELPDPSEATEFLNYGTFDVKEGDIIFFPTFLVHRSPPITSNKRKTIVAANIEFRVDRDSIGNG